MNRVLNLKKGDHVVVALIPQSNATREIDMSTRNIKNWTHDGIVTVVNERYITVKTSLSSMDFFIDDDYKNKNDIGKSEYQLFSSLEEVYNTYKKKSK